MMEVPVRDLLTGFPPWAISSLLLGVMVGAGFFIVAGKRFLSLPLYLVLGALAALLGQIASLVLELEPWPAWLGQLHLAVVCAATLTCLFAARLYRL